MLEPNPPSHTYYRLAQGRWRGVMNVRVTNVRALVGAMGLLNALSAMMLAWWPSFLGRFELETTVEYDPQKPVRHTTTIYWLRFPMMRSVEYVTLDPDGKNFALSGESTNTLLPWRRLTMEGTGHVDQTATVATYNLTWMGAQMTQTTHRQNDRVVLTQNAPGFSAIQNLIAPPE